MEAQPSTMSNSVSITLNESEDWHTDYNKMRAVFENDIVNRPSQREWLYPSLHSQVLDCFNATPVTDVVFGWIKDDLQSLGWI